MRKKLLALLEGLRPLASQTRLRRWLPRRFISHWIVPALVPGSRPRYDAKPYWERYYDLAAGWSDGVTICPSTPDALAARYHYNSVENSILRYFIAPGLPKQPRVLDIGSGAGHWIDFYKDVFDARSAVGIEISELCAAKLKQKYEGDPAISIIRSDISETDFDLGRKFDVINAIGVMFHIVDDLRWKQALKSLAAHLEKDGILILGGDFGLVTRDVQFGGKDPDNPNVNKRIRSMGLWRSAAREAGLEIVARIKTQQARGIPTPHNNVLFLRAARRG